MRGIDEFLRVDMGKGCMGRNSVKRNCRSRHERGAEMVELAIIMPLFVGLLFVCFDLARMANGYAAVHSAAYRASRDSAALQRTEWAAITSINFSGSPPGTNVGNEIEPASLNDTVLPHPEFRTPGNGADPTFPIANSSWYTCMMTPAAGGSVPCISALPQNLTSLYRLEVRAIAYANQLMKENTGSDKYPCDGNSAEALANPQLNYAGCFRCFTLRGVPGYDQLFKAGGPLDKWFIKVLALRCQYDVPITSTSIALGWLPRYITVSSDVFVDVDFYGNNLFYPDP